MFYGDQYRWWVGQVVSVLDDPLKLGRCQVRIQGLHSPEIPDRDLPWASVVLPTTQGGVSGTSSTAWLQPGARVVGWFLDGDASQQPIIYGSIPILEGQVQSGGVGPRSNSPNNPGFSGLHGSQGNGGIPSTPNIVPPASLANDTQFQSKFQEMKAKYPGDYFTLPRLYQIIKGESAFNTRALNRSSNAAGLFQFIPSTLRDLNSRNGTSHSSSSIRSMTAAQQLQVYDEYLSRWNYKGNNHLGMMQAAPAFANRSPDTIVYRINTQAWAGNSGWRDPKPGGPVTVRGINQFYDSK